MKKHFYALAILLALPAADALAGPGGRGGNREALHQKRQERMKEADTNGDGVITKAEFLAKSEERFNKMDKDNDGQLTQKDRDAMHDKVQKIKGKKGSAVPGADAGSSVGSSAGAMGKDDGETFP